MTSNNLINDNAELQDLETKLNSNLKKIALELSNGTLIIVKLQKKDRVNRLYEIQVNSQVVAVLNASRITDALNIFCGQMNIKEIV